jgi:hypothetical protein
MRILLRSFVKLEGSFLKHSFDKLTKAPHVVQKHYLLQILKRNRGTEYGTKYNFANIYNEGDYQKSVSINRYQDLEPDIEKIINGRKNVLTAEMPFMFNLTSGSSDKPKFIPITNRTKRRTDVLMRQWLYRTFLSHPSFLDKFNFTITSSAVEGETQSGIPYGSASGLLYKNLPRVMRSSYVLPFVVSDIQNYDLRYYVMARLAFEKDISVICTPNPTTLIKIAEIGIQYQEEIIRSIQNGCLFTRLDFEININDSKIVNLINASLLPNRLRAQFLNKVIKDNGRLLPYCCWPSLKILGCWLGGSVGCQVDKLSTCYGNVPKRDIGYLASEGSFTLPYEDYTPSGILALQNNYYEFIPEEVVSNTNPQVLLSHELEIGKNYKVILTNESGLYRYDINDTVRVEKFYNQTPVLAFIRKTNDVLNITGEKVHVNQLIMTFQKIEKKFNIEIRQFRVISNLNYLRYDIFLELGQEIVKELLMNSVLPTIDLFLAEINIEYAQKRKSKRLNAPCLHIMDSSWEANVRKQLIESGKRDIQYKWQSIASEFLEVDRGYVKYTLSYKE